MNETAVSLGASGSLVGVYTEAGEKLDNAPGVLILNAGITHRSGPFRLHVEVARRLAASGYPCLRIDLAGIGDSPLRAEEIPEQDGTLSDAQAAMEFLASQAGCRRFVLFGLCSGADDSHLIAMRDQRVAGIIALDRVRLSKRGSSRDAPSRPAGRAPPPRVRKGAHEIAVLASLQGPVGTASWSPP